MANDLKTIYHAPSEDAALEALDRVTEKWENNYPNAMKSLYKNWDVISPIFKFSSDVRKVIYTTNAIEDLNSGYRRLNKQSVFPSDTALLKALYLATHGIAKKWTEMDYAAAELGHSPGRTGDHVPRQNRLSRRISA